MPRVHMAKSSVTSVGEVDYSRPKHLAASQGSSLTMIPKSARSRISHGRRIMRLLLGHRDAGLDASHPMSLRAKCKIPMPDRS
jgi:hypothetical protein